MLTLRSAPEMNLADVVRDGNTAESYGLLSNAEPRDYLLTPSNMKPWNGICREKEVNI